MEAGVHSLDNNLRGRLDPLDTNVGRAAPMLSSMFESMQQYNAELMRTREDMNNELELELLGLNLRCDHAHTKQDSMLAMLRVVMECVIRGSSPEQTPNASQLSLLLPADVMETSPPMADSLTERADAHDTSNGEETEPSSTVAIEAPTGSADGNIVNESSRPNVEDTTAVCYVEAMEPKFPRLILNNPRQMLLNLILTPEAQSIIEGIASVTTPEIRREVEEGIISSVRAGLFIGQLSQNDVLEVYREIVKRKKDKKQQAGIHGRRLERLQLPCPEVTLKEVAAEECLTRC